MDDLGALDDPTLARVATATGDARARRAEALLCARLRPRICVYGRRHLGDHGAADDLAQRVLTVLVEKLRNGGLDDPDRTLAFVLAVSRRAVSVARRGTRRRVAAMASYAAASSDTVVRPPAAETPDLARCLEALADRERATIVLSYYAELESDDIGRELGTTPGNVRVLRHRAMAKLARCMGAEETR